MYKKLIIIILLCLPNLKTQAQDTSISKKKLVASKITQPITIDGELNETIWKQTETASDFVMFEPDNGKLASNELRTEVKVLYDNDAVYISAILYDNEPEAILKEITERDNFGISDSFGVFINGYNDGQQDFQFYVTASNGQADCNFTSQDGEDYSWNAIWESKSKITNFGWIVEMRIPYAAIRFPENTEQVWGINFFREVRRKRQKFSWSPINNQIATFSQQAGILEGVSKIDPPTRLFLIPYASSC